MRALLFFVLLLLATPLFAAFGTITYIAAQGSAEIFVRSGQFAKPVNATGLIASNALVARVPFSGGTCAIALDADMAQGTQYSRVRLDVTGIGIFTPENSLEILKGQNNYYPISAKDLSLKIGNHIFPVRVDGYIINTGIRLTLGTEAQATCTFGENSYTVRIRDGNGNWHFSDPNPTMSLPVRGNLIPGDRVVVNSGRMQKGMGLYGQPIEVDGHWYQVAISQDETTITVTPFTGPIGSIANVGNWNGLLVGSKYMLQVNANGAQSLSVPTDDYHLVSFSSQQLNFYDAEGKGKVCVVRANTTATIDIGAPFITRVEVKQDGRNQTFSFKGTNVAGIPVRLGNRIPFEVTDAQGNKVYNSTFENG